MIDVEGVRNLVGTRVMKTQLHPKTKVIDGIMAKESKELIDDFFKNKREGK